MMTRGQHVVPSQARVAGVCQKRTVGLHTANDQVKAVCLDGVHLVLGGNAPDG